MSELPEIVFASSDPVESRRIAGWVNDGALRPLLPRAYTSNLSDELSAIVKRNIWYLLGNLLQGSLISHRTAIEHRVSPQGNIYMTAQTRRVYRWPGVNIRITVGHKPLDSDPTYYDGLFVSSFERACLENLTASRRVDNEKRNVEQGVIEQRLLDVLNTRGEGALNEIRERARGIARILKMEKEFELLDQIIGSILTTRSTDVLKSTKATAHALGEPYDSGRIELFTILAAELRARTFPIYSEKTTSLQEFVNFAFFESYFSNYIEGTTFLIDEAIDIVYNDAIIPLRTEDSHDIKGTYRICADRQEMQVTPSSAEDLIGILKSRHAILLGGRPYNNPGAFKSKTNRAGDTVFVEPQFVRGTLKMAFRMYDSLHEPVARALLMMFLISEVHPFTDGNGRIARIMMNAELVRQGQTKIIIPTVFRDDYLLALRRLSRQYDPHTYIRTMLRALSFSHSLGPGDLHHMRAQLDEANAFMEPEGNILNWPEN